MGQGIHKRYAPAFSIEVKKGKCLMMLTLLRMNNLIEVDGFTKDPGFSISIPVKQNRYRF